MDTKEYLLNHPNEGTRIYHIVKHGRIDLLQQIFPTAEDLVARLKNNKDFNYDIMANLAMDGNIDMLDKIINTYFAEKTEHNNALRREFLLSHHIGSSPKDYHYFAQYLNSKMQLWQKYELSKSDEERIQLRAKLLNNEPVTYKNIKMENFYYHLRDAYAEVEVKENPHKKINNKRMGIAPKGIAANELHGYTCNPQQGNALVISHYKETYPNIRLVKLPINQDVNTNLICPTIDIKAQYNPSRNDLAEQAFNSMHFPDLWFGYNYFNYLHKIGKMYQDIHDNDPIAFTYFKNFNENNKFISLENTINKTAKGNSNSGNYAAYSSKDYICLRTDCNYYDETLLHELTHDIDHSNDFINSDMYNFAATAMAANPTHSSHRTVAVVESRGYYPTSQYETESLARIMEAYPDTLYKNDELLASIAQAFFVYGDAKLNEDEAIINRIKLCMRLRLSGKTGYKNFEEASKAKRQWFINEDHNKGIADGILYQKNEVPPQCNKEDVDIAERNFKAKYKQLYSGQYMSVGGKDVSYLYVEKELKRCINDELTAIEQIKQNPIATKVVLDIDTVSRDNITETSPLELEVANTFLKMQNIQKVRLKMQSDEQCEQNLSTENNTLQEINKILQDDNDKGMPLDREKFCEGIKQNVKVMMIADKLVNKYFPNYVGKELNINDCLPQTINMQNGQTKIANLQKNIEYIKDIKIPPEIIDNPYSSMVETAIKQGERMYNRYNASLSHDKTLNEERSWDIEDMLNNMSRTDKTGQLANLITMQLIYSELHPNAKTLPKELQFENLTAKSFERDIISQKTPLQNILNNYKKQCFNIINDLSLNISNEKQYS